MQRTELVVWLLWTPIVRSNMPATYVLLLTRALHMGVAIIKCELFIRKASPKKEHRARSILNFSPISHFPVLLNKEDFI